MNGEAYRNFTEDGAWCFFADPRGVYFAGTYRRTYLGWMTKEGDVMIGSYDHDSETVDTMLIRERLQKDDHANPALHIDEEGRIIIFYSAHNGEYMHYRVAEQVEHIGSFGMEMKIPVNTEGLHGYTYPNPVYLKAEKTQYLFWRGGHFKPTFSSRVDGEEWSEARTLIKGNGARPYIRFATGGEDTIYFAYTDGHPNIEPNNGIYCGYYKEEAVYRMNGERICSMAELPFHPHEADTVFNGNSSGSKAWIWDIAADAKGYPVIVYAVFASETDHRYFYSRWDGSQWAHHEIVAAGPWFPQTPEGGAETEHYYSGGLILDRQNPANVYLSRSIDGVFEIEHWLTDDNGITWSSSAVTSGSSRHNVRPFLAPGDAGGEGKLLLWMHGSYVHYTNYDTALKMKLVAGVE
jgi:hypothetical protein